MATLTNIYFRGRDSGCSVFILLYISVVLPLIITIDAEVQNDYRFTCYNDSSYAEGSHFQSNLNTVLHGLVQNTPQSRFSTFVYGQSPDQVYGLLQCRGDTTKDQCNYCSQEANTSIRQYCGKAFGGIIWSDLCYLIYNNSPFFGQLDTHNYWCNNEQYTVSRPGVFRRDLEDLFNELSAKAAYGSSTLYASGTGKNLSPKISALVQCRRDMSPDKCKSCLTELTTYILKDYRGRQGVRCYMESCIVRYELYPFFDPPSTAEAPANKPLSKSTHSNKIPTILGVVGGGGLLLALLVCLFTTWRRLNSAIYQRGYEVHEQVEEDTLVCEDRQIVAFKMETLVAATGNFHDDNKLGEGGFGPVYKGAIHDGKEIAVKKLSLTSLQGKKEFMTEVKLVAKIQHRNLVKLLGCCAEGLEKLLVYEYLPNSSLDKILFDPIKRKELDWQKRYNIILGVARGLLYLHEDSQPRIIHRDIKASNILLDEKWNPKIADFGLAKLFPDNESYVGTLTKVAGTPGYMAPEYAMHSQLTAKADVYSFGVLLLELVTGRKNMDYNLSPEMQNLLRWVWRSYEGGNNVEIVDPVATIESCDEEQALRCIHIGLLCTQVDSSLRPPMSIVTLMLSSHKVPLPDLTNPVFADSDSRINMSYSSSLSGLSRASATTSSSSSDLVPAPPSNAYSSSIELVPRSY